MPTFVVLAHNQPTLLARLCQRLEPYPVVVHIDGKKEIGPFRSATWSQRDRVTFLKERVPIAWAGFSMVRATTNLYVEALRITDPSDHVVLLSGQCYPIRPVTELDEFLKSCSYRQHCHAVPLIEAPHKRQRKILRRHFLDLAAHRPLDKLSLEGQRGFRQRTFLAISEGISRVVPGRPLDHRTLYGSQWTAFTAECIREMLEIANRGWTEHFLHSHAPDELFFHTLLHQSRFSAESPAGMPEHFECDGTAQYANLHLLDPSLERTYVASDYEEVVSSRRFFVRKVILPDSGALLDALDAGNRCHTESVEIA